MHKHSEHERQRQEWLSIELIAPEVRKIRKADRKESVFSCFDEFDRGLLENDELVQNWIESGTNLGDLARLLQERPPLLEVDLIRKQLFHLKSLADGFMPLADSFGGLAADKQTAAQEHLKRIAEGMVQGLLPGYSVKIAVDVPTGRPRSIDPEKLLQDLKGLLGALDWLLEKDSLFLLRKRQESPSVFACRIAKLAQDVYQNSHLSFSTSVSPHKPFLDGQGQPAVNLNSRSLDLATSWRIGKRANQKQKRASFKLLVLGILEYHYRISTKALASQLARAKEKYPDRFESLCRRYPLFGRF